MEKEVSRKKEDTDTILRVEREDIRDKVLEVCLGYEEKEEPRIRVEKGFKVYDRGFVKNMFRTVRSEYTWGIVRAPYTANILWNLCCLCEVMEEMCERYNQCPNVTMLSLISGVSISTLNNVLYSADNETIGRMDLLYDRDLKTYFHYEYERLHKAMNKPINLAHNIEESYPLYCMLMDLREAEKDSRVERGKLGDITHLNAPIELGGFGYAHPAVMVDKRQLIIGDESKLIESYSSAKKHINSVKVDTEKKELLEKECEALFAKD